MKTYINADSLEDAQEKARMIETLMGIEAPFDVSVVRPVGDYTKGRYMLNNHADNGWFTIVWRFKNALLFCLEDTGEHCIYNNGQLIERGLFNPDVANSCMRSLIASIP